MSISFGIKKGPPPYNMERTTADYWTNQVNTDSWTGTVWASDNNEVELISNSDWSVGMDATKVKITTSSPVTGGQILDVNSGVMSDTPSIGVDYIEFNLTPNSGSIPSCGTFHNHVVDYGSSIYYWNVRGIFATVIEAEAAFTAAGYANNAGDATQVYTGDEAYKWGQLVNYHYEVGTGGIYHCTYEVFVYPESAYASCVSIGNVDLNKIYITSNSSFNITKIEFAAS